MKFNTSTDISIEIKEVGDSHIFIIDNFLTNPDDLVDYATKRAYFSPPGKDGTLYPGIRDLLPKPYERVLEELCKIVHGSDLIISVHRCLLSLVTVEEDNLGELQTFPHIDSIDNTEFACVHYLCSEKYGGTSIYKYIPENIIKITEEETHIFEDILKNNRNKKYLNGSTELFERVVEIKAKYNRIVIYPSNLLHCADINHTYSISNDPKVGRLTVASFYKITPL